MSEINALLTEEATRRAYEDMRNDTRTTITTGVEPNAKRCLAQYERLQVALSGGDAERGIPDISAYTEHFAKVTGPVTPFINLLQAALRIVVYTPKLIDQGAKAQGMTTPPFGVDTSTPLDPADYAAMLQQAAAAIQATGQALQAMAQGDGK